MCGRYVLVARAKQLAAFFNISLDAAIDLALLDRPRYNLAPSQSAPILRIGPESGVLELAGAKWGLVPAWSKEPKTTYSTINAMAETVDAKPAYRAAFKKRRCIVPMDGFYEWRKESDGTKTPHYIRQQDEKPLRVAGLWEHWEREGEVLESFTVVTTEANELMKQLHHRMPVIFGEEAQAAWLDDTQADAAALKSLLRPCPAAWLASYPVSKLVNNPRNDQPACIEPWSGSRR